MVLIPVVEYLSTKGQVSIDVQGYLREVSGEQVRAVDWKDKERILACTDILKLNEHEMEVITHSRNPRTVALQLADMGVKEVIITLGSYGSLICTLKLEHSGPFDKTLADIHRVMRRK